MENNTVKVHMEKRRQWLIDVLIRLFKEKPLGAAGGVLFLLMILVAIFAKYLAPYPPNTIDLSVLLHPPSTAHLLGTDNLGRDLLSRIIYGARTSVTVGVLGPAISLVVSTILGITSGFVGGKFDLILQRFIDAWMCFPGIIVLLTLISIVGQGIVQLILILGIFGGIGGSRTIRSAVINIRNDMYVQSAEAMGAPTSRILIKHILPNISAMLIILYTSGMAGAILAESSLSFLGFGVPPPNPSWGGILSMEGRLYMLEAPHICLFPGIVLSVTVFGVSMLGDALRDLLDPRLRGGLGSYKKQRPRKVYKKKEIQSDTN